MTFDESSLDQDPTLKYIPTALQAYNRSLLTQQQIEEQAYPILHSIGMQIQQFIHRKYVVHAFPTDGDRVPDLVVSFVAEFFRARGYNVNLHDAGIVVEWKEPGFSEYDNLENIGYPLEDPTEPEIKSAPRYTIGTGDRTIGRKS